MVQKITQFLPHLAHAAKNGFMGALLVGVLVFSIQYGYERFSPDEHWVSFKSIQTEREYSTEEAPTFGSIAVYPRGGSTQWTDILRCDTNGDGIFEFFSVYVSSAILGKTSNFPEVDPANPTIGGWRYQAPTPKMDAVCFIDSTTEVKTPLGLTKTEKILSGQFDIVKE